MPAFNLRRAISGAAGAGAKVALQEQKADIMEKRDEKLNQYENQRMQDKQDFSSSEREAKQEFTAEENQKERDARMEVEALRRNSKLLNKKLKIPEYDKSLRRMAAETFNSSLGDSFNFEGDNAEKAANLHVRSLEILSQYPEAQRYQMTGPAYQQALQELRQQEARPSPDEIRRQVEQEAREKGGFEGPFDDKDFGGMSREEWIEQETQKRLGQAGGTPDAGGQGAPAADIQLPPQAAQQLKEGVQTTFKNGQVWSLQNGQPVRIK